jgi:hypothetical protein
MALEEGSRRSIREIHLLSPTAPKILRRLELHFLRRGCARFLVSARLLLRVDLEWAYPRPVSPTGSSGKLVCECCPRVCL